MKKLFFIFMLAGSLPLLAYDITVTNETKGIVTVYILGPDAALCASPNPGAKLNPGETNWWPTHNICTNKVKFIYPDRSYAEHIATASDNTFTVYRNARGEYHYR